MAEESQAFSIAEQIDRDEGLRAKRNLLSITSLILLAVSFSGAKVEEANTFILKISFENQQGIPVFLVVAIMFLLLRYYNYACKYHNLLYKLWADRLVKNPYFFYSCYHSDEVSGLVIDIKPEGFIDGADRYNPHVSWGSSFKCQLPFVRKIAYWKRDEHDEYHAEVRVGWKNYRKVLWLEARYQFGGLLKDREHLDIIAPYILGVTAILSYGFNSYFQWVINVLIPH